MRSMLAVVLFLSLPISGQAQARCLDPAGKGAEKIREIAAAHEKARAQALKRKGWQKLTPEDPTSTHDLLENTGRVSVHPGLRLLAKGSDAGTSDAFMFLGDFAQAQMTEATWVMDSSHLVFQIDEDVTFRPTGRVTLCGCEDTGGGGAPPPPPHFQAYFVRVPRDARLVDRMVLSYTVRAPKIVWSRGLCPPRP